MKILSNIQIDENKFKEFNYYFFKDNEDEVYLEVEEDENSIQITAKNSQKEIKIQKDKLIPNQLDVMLKTSLLTLYDISVPWGSLVGVRPTKLVRKLLETFNYQEIENILMNIYLVSKEKTKLLIDIVKNSIEYLDDKTIGLYIGLAFCPTKCTYCSFPAYLKKGKYEKRYDEYFNCIIEEIKETGKYCKEKGLIINSVYIGGGTPSYLSYEELETMLETIDKYNDLSNLKEYTFEAGRIDTIDQIKLEKLKRYGISRISINPQSFKSSTLKLVNRYHDIEKLNEVYHMAKQMEFDINMDFIIGLPKEDTKDVLDTLEYFRNYDVENVTFHYLAMKKASHLTKSNYFFDKELDYLKINDKIEEIMKEKGYIPYYMYRQKNSSEYGENKGYCKPGKQLIYNIEMIEEYKSIIGIGAGAITKLISKGDIKRVINPKDPLMWVDEFNDRLNDKLSSIEEFLEG